MNPLKKQTNFPIIISSIIIVLLIIVLFGSWLYFWNKNHQDSPTTKSDTKNNLSLVTPGSQNTQPSSKTGNTSTSNPNQTLSLPVTKLKSFGNSDANNGLVDYNYPNTISVTGPKDMLAQVQAYGGGGQVFLGPKGWNGSESEGAGDSMITISNGGNPSGPLTHTDKRNIPYMSVRLDVTALSINEAEPYFPNLAKLDNGITQTSKDNFIGIKLNQITPNLTGYTLPSKASNLEINGIVFTGADMTSLPSTPSPTFAIDTVSSPFIQVEISLPPSQHALAQFLLNDFITRNNLKDYSTVMAKYSDS